MAALVVTHHWWTDMETSWGYEHGLMPALNQVTHRWCTELLCSQAHSGLAPGSMTQFNPHQAGQRWTFAQISGSTRLSKIFYYESLSACISREIPHLITNPRLWIELACVPNNQTQRAELRRIGQIKQSSCCEQASTLFSLH